MLAQKSLTELRGIAQSLGVGDVFRMDRPHLMQAIELKQSALSPVVKHEPVMPQYDARLMTKPPARKSGVKEIRELLEDHVARGLVLSFNENEERWMMKIGDRTDEGTIRMPLRVVLHCANKLMS